VSGQGDPIDVDLYEQAKPLGVAVIESDAWQLQVDIDVPSGESVASEFYEEKVDKAREQILRDWCIGDVLVTKSRNGNQHMYATLRQTTDVRHRVALQLAMGSDPIREVLVLKRLTEAPKRPPMVMFETPEEAQRVRQFLVDRWKHLRQGAV
jgi:hypothetical protein